MSPPPPNPLLTQTTKKPAWLSAEQIMKFNLQFDLKTQLSNNPFKPGHISKYTVL